MAGRHSALPFVIRFLLQCVSNPSSSPQLHLAPVAQVTILLYLGLRSIFIFEITVSELGAIKHLSGAGKFTAGLCKKLANQCSLFPKGLQKKETQKAYHRLGQK